MNEEVEEKFLAVSAWGDCLASVGLNSALPFARQLVNLGWKIVPVGDSRASFFIAYEHSRKHLRAIQDEISISNRFLVTGEPRAVLPDQYRLRVRRKYGKVFIPTELQKVTREEIVYGFAGLPSREQVELNLKNYFQNGRRKDSFAILNENKVSLVPGSKYATRKNLIRNIARSGREIHVGGRLWDDGFWANLSKHRRAALFSISSRTWPNLALFTGPLPANNPRIKILGPVDSAVQFLSNFEFAVVIENDPTYVSEKLFNAWMAGCVPLYSGPNLRHFGIPDECYVALPIRSKDLPMFLNDLRALDLTTKRQAIRDFLSNPSTQVRWSHECLHERLAVMIESELQIVVAHRGEGLYA